MITYQSNRTIRTAHYLTVCVLLYTSPPVLCQPQSQHPTHSGCKHCTSRSELHGIGGTSLTLHDHFWLPGAKRCPERGGVSESYTKVFEICILNTFAIADFQID